MSAVQLQLQARSCATIDPAGGERGNRVGALIRKTTIIGPPHCGHFQRPEVGVRRLSLQCGCIGRRSEALETKRQKRGPVPIGKISEVPDAHETLREQVKQKAAQELICRERHGLFSVAMRAVSPAKCDLSVGKGNQAVVGNGHSMGVAAEISEHIFRAAEGPFAVDDPFVTE